MESCINPRCENESHCRGLCKSCYQTCVKMIRRGTVTWEQLEAAGKIKPSTRVTAKTIWLKEAVG